MSSDISVQEYLDVLRFQRQLSPHTLDNYSLDLQELQKFAQGRSLDSLSYYDVRRFTSQMHAQGLSARSIARKLSSWRGYYRWLAQQIDLPANPVDGIKAPKKSKSLPKALGADDAVNLVAHHGSDAPSMAANRAMFELLYSSGLRVSELVALDLQDFGDGGRPSQGWVDLAQAEVHVTGKGNKQRIVPVGKPALDAIRDWLAVRGQLLKTDNHPLFLTERGTRMSVRLVQLRLKAHAQAMGVPSDVHPHVLRHSFATHVLQSSGDLRAVQEMLGHSSIAATQVYTALDFQHLAKVYDATHPRAKK
ncbi:tyrosine recombinase XerC [Undibacterium sp. LX40W]|uniref:Tyrosine recombinase XerC n=1 Tax=Undibacterium nitidum TaxID=2762298 RepID=A0A923HLZ3_9BURK|nr:MULTISPECIES: tyrosine recombinase XerC [Undibacterium]MBC3881839.1 tyrosine recombinase XerC [Undibacterium nitidum]MBC3892164.1 tyrosine recombinase XerC [Undibacterium sp. LX40W]